ncbi:XrtN system VIT domain-containing protein [Chitinophaga pollutisoli]|uniref:XrtN system VIT domain-containing protein n=1 Tax=Chitinophaga pollutisoli TaxID=3133966 RepID=A0ABZ2YPE8_9BACT
MENKRSLKQRLLDHRYLTYISALLFSLLLYCFGNLIDTPRGDTLFTLFVVHAGLAILCLICYMTMERKKPYSKDIKTVLWLLWLVSCYALNREIPVFDESTTWQAVLLVISGATLLTFRYADLLPGWGRALLGISAGVATLLFAYLAICCIPLFPFAAVGIILLGLGFHAFVPAFLVYHTISAIRNLQLGKPALTGAALSLLIVAAFCIRYAMIVQDINQAYNRKMIEGSDELPAWVETANQLRPGFVNDRVLKTGLVFTTSEVLQNLFDFDMPNRNFDARNFHDPLVTIAHLFSPALRPDHADRIKILEALYDSRHEAQERLWSGDKLSTTYVHTCIRLWPEQHLAYTEKSITVYNAARWGAAEGIYSFELPEGGVVTSLSLWINGKEEKAILTTKEKADTAYKTIVGVEQRDPSLVRWQEGNTVSLRVFPVNSMDSRVFKIGVTAPLKVEGGKMIYYNIAFRGPVFRRATEYTSITNEGDQLPAVKPAGFARNGTLLEREGAYRPNWQLEMPLVPLRPQTFAFNGNAYTIQAYEPERSSVSTSAIYLDINHSWTRADMRTIFGMAGNIPIKTFAGDKFVSLTKENFREHVEPLLDNRFSLFPFHRIPDPAGALVITKNTTVSPALTDLEGSVFRLKLAERLADPAFPKIRLYDLGTRLSPYLASLKAARAFRYEQGNVTQLRELLNKGLFAEDPETPDKVVIDEAKAAIVRRADSSATGTAPDHLMRLFAYNHILQQTGKGLITGSQGQEHLVAAAKEAYVVSPISSLVVLETQQDYDRFGIHDEGNSLKNASLNGNGAVPEPHEWALIVLAIVSLYIYLNRRRWTVSNA